MLQGAKGQRDNKARGQLSTCLDHDAVLPDRIFVRPGMGIEARPA